MLESAADIIMLHLAPWHVWALALAIVIVACYSMSTRERRETLPFPDTPEEWQRTQLHRIGTVVSDACDKWWAQRDVPYL